MAYKHHRHEENENATKRRIEYYGFSISAVGYSCGAGGPYRTGFTALVTANKNHTHLTGLRNYGSAILCVAAALPRVHVQ